MKNHQLMVAKTKYPGGLRLYECDECRYAFAAEVDQNGIIEMHSKVMINDGDYQASHSLFQTPEIDLELSVSSDVEHEDRRPALGD